MNTFKPLSDEHMWEEVLRASEDELVVVFKHSATCMISAEAHEEILAFLEENDTPVYKVVVQEDREVSDLIAEDMDIKHESPQVIVLDDREPIFQASHYDVTKDALEAVLKEE